MTYQDIQLLINFILVDYKKRFQDDSILIKVISQNSFQDLDKNIVPINEVSNHSSLIICVPNQKNSFDVIDHLLYQITIEPSLKILYNLDDKVTIEKYRNNRKMEQVQMEISTIQNIIQQFENDTRNKYIKADDNFIKTENIQINAEDTELRADNIQIKTENIQIKTENIQIKTQNIQIKNEISPIKAAIDWMSEFFAPPLPIEQLNDRKKVAVKGGQMAYVQLERPKVLNRQQGYTPQQISLHNKPDDAWTVLNGKVYDITLYMNYHPGGREKLMLGAGKDSTQLFNQFHQWINGHAFLEKDQIGLLNRK